MWLTPETYQRLNTIPMSYSHQTHHSKWYFFEWGWLKIEEKQARQTKTQISAFLLLIKSHLHQPPFICIFTLLRWSGFLLLLLLLNRLMRMMKAEKCLRRPSSSPLNPNHVVLIWLGALASKNFTPHPTTLHASCTLNRMSLRRKRHT